jgi:ribokinase
MTSLKVDIQNCRYKAMIGTGGIGSGMFFQLSGNETLGREESRSCHILDRNDYCKLHIISHYVQTLLGLDFHIYPIGKVGIDDAGKKLLQEMAETGFAMDYVESTPDSPTLFSFCFQYPDGTGGNLTTGDSACSKVSAGYVNKAEKEFIRYASHGIALAAPEVPLAAREELLDIATLHHFFRVASITSEEMKSAIHSDFFSKVDLLAINLDEAARAAEFSIGDHDHLSIISSAIKVFTNINPKIEISVTVGKEGSWSWDGSSLNHIPAFPVKVVNTAGAGDAHLAGIIVGLTTGMSLHDAQQLASLTASSSVESPHTINKGTDKNALRKISFQSQTIINKNVSKLLEE